MGNRLCVIPYWRDDGYGHCFGADNSSSRVALSGLMIPVSGVK